MVIKFFFKNFKVFISRFDFQNVYVKPNWPNFSNFWTQKNPNNKYFRKSICIYKKRILSQKRVHIQKRNTKTKNFCDTPLVVYKQAYDTSRGGRTVHHTSAQLPHTQVAFLRKGADLLMSMGYTGKNL